MMNISTRSKHASAWSFWRSVCLYACVVLSLAAGSEANAGDATLVRRILRKQKKEGTVSPKPQPGGYPFVQYAQLPVPAIPCLLVNVILDSNLLLLRLLYSIDYPINTIIIATAGNSSIVERELAHATRHFRNVRIERPKDNRWLGVAESWNMPFNLTDAPWALVTAVDIQFIPGSLKAFAQQFWKQMEDENLDLAFVEFANTDPLHATAANHRFNIFGITRRLTERIGLFDENIYPAYFEDTEFLVRVYKQEDNPVVMRTFNGILVFHGLPKTDDHDADGRGITHQFNEFEAIRHRVWTEYAIPYLKEKWGCTHFQKDYWEDRKNCVFEHPFDNPKNPISYWTLDKQRRKQIMAIVLSGLSSGKDPARG